ncbi:polyketide cyclase/dehydrase and lipid transport [Leptospira fainei serovar Hurstbridge str. BUT 6]|uniref:Polyketide cyclase/dehydrase and lipid transport n=1 Tax=Leptospira fainei serovar Hurstbridge str. BUT 6 TaxID=1193011 RepID=S3W2W5_9LEPT|nr:SRPBCC family protein [Leptospira fainei]EPG74597.1 polyketide cyclase/dehydrase and lipid transport [Leptospira fainei serovar Hurstbridge str. BUT 6]
MKAFRITILGLVALALVLIVVGLLLPSSGSVSRSIVIKAPPEEIFAYVANFKKGWGQWSDFDYEDPEIKYSYSGPEEGVGASRTWISKKMGNGSQKIIKADKRLGVEFELAMQDTNFSIVGKFSFEPESSGTKVTWTDSWDSGYHLGFRYMALLMDKMMGPTFERSLSALKEKAESQERK